MEGTGSFIRTQYMYLMQGWSQDHKFLSVSKVTLHRLHEISIERQRVLLMLLPIEQWGWGVGSGLVWREVHVTKGVQSSGVKMSCHKFLTNVCRQAGY